MLIPILTKKTHYPISDAPLFPIKKMPSENNQSTSFRDRARKVIMLIRILQMYQTDTQSDKYMLHDLLTQLSMSIDGKNPFKNHSSPQSLRKLFQKMISDTGKGTGKENIARTKLLCHQLCPPFTDTELLKSVERDGKLIQKFIMCHKDIERNESIVEPYLFSYFQRMYYWYGYSNDTFVATRYVCNILEAYLTLLLHTGDIMADARNGMHQDVWKDYFGHLEYVFTPAKEHFFSPMENQDMYLRGVMSAEDKSGLNSIYFQAYKPYIEGNDYTNIDDINIVKSETGYKEFKFIMQQFFPDPESVVFPDVRHAKNMMEVYNQQCIPIDKWSQCVGFLEESHGIKLVIIVISNTIDDMSGVVHCVPIGYKDKKDFERCAVAVVAFADSKWNIRDGPRVATIVGFSQPSITTVSVSGIWSHDAFKTHFNPLWKSITGEKNDNPNPPTYTDSVSIHRDIPHNISRILYPESGNALQT